MQNLRLIKGRIRSAKSIAQITKAMELVAASKMKRAQAAAVSGKLYAEKIREMVMVLGTKVDVSAHPLLKRPETMTGKRMVILITSNKGLSGGLNSALFRVIAHHYPDLKQHSWVTVGLKGANFVSAMGATVLADFSEKTYFIPAVPAIAELVTEQFLRGSIDGVDLVYNEFASVLKQEPRIRPILPLTMEGSNAGSEVTGSFLIEPNQEEVFETLLPSYVENQIRNAVLQAEASDQAARMVAMRNATDNANSFIGELTLIYNKIRQEKITNEIADLVTARAAIAE